MEATTMKRPKSNATSFVSQSKALDRGRPLTERSIKIEGRRNVILQEIHSCREVSGQRLRKEVHKAELQISERATIIITDQSNRQGEQ